MSGGLIARVGYTSPGLVPPATENPSVYQGYFHSKQQLQRACNFALPELQQKQSPSKIKTQVSQPHQIEPSPQRLELAELCRWCCACVHRFQANVARPYENTGNVNLSSIYWLQSKKGGGALQIRTTYIDHRKAQYPPDQ